MFVAARRLVFNRWMHFLEEVYHVWGFEIQRLVFNRLLEVLYGPRSILPLSNIGLVVDLSFRLQLTVSSEVGPDYILLPTITLVFNP